MLKIEWASLCASLLLIGVTWATITIFGNPSLSGGWFIHHIPETFLCFTVGAFCGFSFFAVDKWKGYCILCWVIYFLVVVVGSYIVDVKFMTFALLIALPFPIGFCLASFYSTKLEPSSDNK